MHSNLSQGLYLSRGTSFPTRLHVLPETTQISLRICAIWSDSSQNTVCSQRTKHLHVDSKDSDQSVRCAGWSEFSLVAHASLLQILFPCSFGCTLSSTKFTFSIAGNRVPTEVVRTGTSKKYLCQGIYLIKSLTQTEPVWIYVSFAKKINFINCWPNLSAVILVCYCWKKKSDVVHLFCPFFFHQI